MFGGTNSRFTLSADMSVYNRQPEETPMRRLLSLFVITAALSLPALAADRLDGVLTLAADDQAAVAQIATTPERHVMLYFGDYQH